ncbi:hypothetical protein [Actinomadura formosensis]|uniref:hypothetical protein n=1 Tax=Actinomadura formosensis TaxID=60706 RepID=UPI000AEEC6AF|nr:hypothetical protein [Actinomadura formosensis]
MEGDMAASEEMELFEQGGSPEDPTSSHPPGIGFYLLGAGEGRTVFYRSAPWRWLLFWRRGIKSIVVMAPPKGLLGVLGSRPEERWLLVEGEQGRRDIDVFSLSAGGRRVSRWAERQLLFGLLGRSYRTLREEQEGMSLAEQLEAAGFSARRPDLYAYCADGSEIPEVVCALHDSGTAIEVLFPHWLIAVPEAILDPGRHAEMREGWEDMMSRRPSLVLPYEAKEIVSYHSRSTAEEKGYQDGGYEMRYPEPHFHTRNGDVLCSVSALVLAYRQRFDAQALCLEDIERMMEKAKRGPWPEMPTTPGDCN